MRRDATVSELSVGWVDPWAGLGWVGSHEMDPWTTLDCLYVVASRRVELCEFGATSEMEGERVSALHYTYTNIFYLSKPEKKHKNTPIQEQ